mgnify:CR=1 FL=1
MDVRHWVVCVIEPNKFERQIILDLLRNAGVSNVCVLSSAEEANEALKSFRANIVITSYELPEQNGALWTRGFRRERKFANRKAAVFITSAAFSRLMAEECRHAGANALIGKPLSAKVLIATIRKVLAAPREFIEAENYVGPCRRAGIVTAGAPKRRRKADAGQAANAPSLQQAVSMLARTASVYMLDHAQIKPCEAALRFVQGYAVNAGDGPLMRACAAFGQLLGTQNLAGERLRVALEACVEGVVRLSSGTLKPAEREALAARLGEVVSRVLAPRAA